MYIKYILVLFSFFVFFSQTVFAEHKEVDKAAIKALIAKVKTVEPSQRRVLMNELKVMLRSMHQETRTQVMLDLRRSFSNNRGSQTRNSAKQSNMYHQSTMSMTESKHMQEHMTQSNMTDMRPPEGHLPPSEHTPMRGM
jgi:hypothetical protein